MSCFKGTRHNLFAEHSNKNLSRYVQKALSRPKSRQTANLFKSYSCLLTRPNSRKTAEDFDPIHLNSLLHAPASHALSIYPSYRTHFVLSYRIQVACNGISWVSVPLHVVSDLPLA